MHRICAIFGAVALLCASGSTLAQKKEAEALGMRGKATAQGCCVYFSEPPITTSKDWSYTTRAECKKMETDFLAKVLSFHENKKCEEVPKK